MSVAMMGDPVTEWWERNDHGSLLYERVQQSPVEAWRRALAAMPQDDGPAPIPPPDRPPARTVDLPEVLALRAHLQDHHAPLDTIERRIRALLTAVAALENKRPLAWSADDVATRCLALAEQEAEGRWSLLEAIREFWAWHPDQPYIQIQGTRLLAFLRLALEPEQPVAGR